MLAPPIKEVLHPVQRIQDNLLARSERRLLTWLAGRMPDAVTPDRLTATGVTGAFAVASGYAFSLFHVEWLWLSIAGYFINWFGDSLDGSLARYREIERPRFGYFIDHSVDSFGNMAIMIGLGISPFLRMDVALFGLGAYLLLSIHTFIAARVVDEFRLSYVAAGPTELRIVLIAMTLCMLVLGPEQKAFMAFSPFDLFIGALGLAMIAAFVVQTTVTARRLSRQGL